jgi:hypothetical protein
MDKLRALVASFSAPLDDPMRSRHARKLMVGIKRRENLWAPLGKNIYMVLLMFAVSAILIVVHQVSAASDVLIAEPPNGPSGTAVDHNGSSPTVVFTSDAVGYAFYVGVTGNCVYKKTLDGGASWGAVTPIVADPQTDCGKIAVWYDRWTPGDTTGNFIHILTMDTLATDDDDDLYYRRLDTSSDTFTTIVNTTDSPGSAKGGTFLASENIPSITKSTTGVLYMGIQDNTDSFVIRCSTNCDTASNWSEAGTNPFDTTSGSDVDWVILMPLSLGDILLIRWDISANVVDSKVYHAGTVWDVGWLTIDGSAPNNVTYDGHFGATVNKTTNMVYLAYAADVATIGTDDDIRTASYLGTVWTPKTNVLTNDVKGVTGAKIATKEGTETIFVIYTARTTVGSAPTGNLYFKRSTDGMLTWGAEQGPLNTVSADLYGARVNIVSPDYIYTTWDNDTDAEFYGARIADLSPTAVEMSTFTAKRSSKGVSLEWRTGYEADNLGFNVYREKKEKRVLVNSSLLAGSALLAGTGAQRSEGDTYSFVDAKGSSDDVYYLEDIDLNGTSTMHGPVTPLGGAAKDAVSAKSTRAISIEELNQNNRNDETAAHTSQRSWTLTPTSERPSSGREPISSVSPDRSLSTGRIPTPERGFPFLTMRPVPNAKAPARQKILAGMSGPKLAVRTNGWYRVSQQALVAAGLDPNADKQYLQLYTDGVEVPMKVNSDSIEFYGFGLNTPSTSTRQYWLIPGVSPGRRINPQILNSGVVNGASTSYQYVVERKDRLVYFSGLLNGDIENFFGRVIASTAVEQTLSVSHLKAGAIEPAQLEVALQGLTRSEHAVKVLVNGSEAGVVSFTGITHQAKQFSLGNAVLHEGDNTISLQSLNGSTDVSLMDYVRLTYAHTYHADGDYLQFTVDDSAQVSGFSVPGVKLLDISNPNAVSLYNPTTQHGADGYGFSVQTHEPRTFLAITEQGVGQVAAITRNQPSNWKVKTQGADLVVITHRDFRNSVEPLAQLRRNEGLTVAVVDVEDLYDEFSYGAHSPQAIRDFLQFAKTNWVRAPRFVLLVGDGSYDPRNYLGNGETDLVPARLIDTAALETVSDDWFVDFNNNGMVEMTIGRLPARTAAEAETMISKIVNYSPSHAVQSAVMVADKMDAKTNFNFEAASEELAGMLPATIGVQKIFRGDNANQVVHDQIMNGINQGPLLVSFLGHGSIEVWTGGPILSTADAAQLSNGSRLPVFLMMTCLNGYYQNPARESLAESLLRTASGGAVAVWASSGSTEPRPQMDASRLVYQQLFGGNPVTLGEAMRKAKLANEDMDVRRTWILLGDPSMRIR